MLASMKTAYTVTIVLAFSMLGGCCWGPNQWTYDASPQLKCGMSVQEVQEGINEQVKTLHYSASWKTHRAEKKDSVIDFEFVNGQLRSYKISWVHDWDKMASFSRIDICSKPFKMLD